MKVVFCFPGNSFSGRFLESWTELFAWCLQNGIQPILSRRESCNIYYVRNMCLGADVTRGKNQKPFNGKLNYDYIMWIDSDIIFTPEHFIKLLNHNKDIVSGIYKMSDNANYATVKEWDEEYFKQNGCFKFLQQGDLTSYSSPAGRGENTVTSSPALLRTEKGEIGNPCSVGTNFPSPCGEGEPPVAVGEVCLLPVSYTGMGFMLVKFGVFESMEYPWFKPLEKQIGDMCDFTMEDVSFCLRAQEKGYKIFVDPAVIVGHEKKMVL